VAHSIASCAIEWRKPRPLYWNGIEAARQISHFYLGVFWTRTSSTQEADLFRKLDYWSLRSAADSVVLPQPEPWAVRELFIVPSIRRRDVACAQWPNIRSLEHLLQLLNVIDDSLNIHA
jgi:hypothetical protein